MRITDCHTHHEGGETDAPAVLKQLDANGIDRILLYSPQERVSFSGTRAKLLRTKKLIDAAPDRISGLAWVEPRIAGMADLVDEALNDFGFSGVKIIPDHYYVYEEHLEPFWERLNKLHAHIMFHTGILYANDDSSRFNRPVYLEKLLHYPNIKFAMAHLSWPWCEEHLAVMGRMQAAAEHGGYDWQSYSDITVGMPPHIHKQALENAISFSGAERIMWGSDTSIPGDDDGRMENQAFRVKYDMNLLDEIGVSAEQKARIMSGTADELFPARR